MFEILSKIPSYYLFRKIGTPKKLPMNLTCSVSYQCNSRCKTCNVYQREADELSLIEWETIFKNIGKDLFWVTFSGGEPFLRKDIAQVVCAAYDHCKPEIINIPTNGLLSNNIARAVETIVAHCKRSQIVINLSIDDIQEKHDAIRGVKGSYDKALKTFSLLKSISSKNLSIGIHTVISKFNVDRIPIIYEKLRTFHPDSYITEIAEERVELGTIGTDITPEYKDYVAAVDFLLDKLKNERFSKVGMLMIKLHVLLGLNTTVWLSKF